MDNGVVHGLDPNERQSIDVTTNSSSSEHKLPTTTSKAGITHISAPTSSRADAETQRFAEIAKLDAAYTHQILYIIGKVSMKVKPGTNLVRATLLKAFLWMRENSRTKVADLRVPGDRVIEVGFVKEV